MNIDLLKQRLIRDGLKDECVSRSRQIADRIDALTRLMPETHRYNGLTEVMKDLDDLKEIIKEYQKG